MNLTPENEAFLAEAVSRGAFANTRDALDEAMRLLGRKLDLEAELIEGLDSGEPIEVDAAFWEARRVQLRRSAERTSDP